MSSDSFSRPPLIVSLTTLPSRIGFLRNTLDSLKAQTRLPDKVLLCLPRWSRREETPYLRPGWLEDYAPMLEVLDCEDDYGPGTKLLGCLDHLPNPTCLVLADDDMQYRPFFLDGLYRAQIDDPGASFSYWTFRCGPFVVGQGADGFSFYSPNLDAILPFAHQALKNPQLRVVDDLWISAYLKNRGVAVRSIRHLIPDERTVYEKVHSVNQLRRLPGDLSRKTAMTVGAQYLLEQGMIGRRLQASATFFKFARNTRDWLFHR